MCVHTYVDLYIYGNIITSSHILEEDFAPTSLNNVPHTSRLYL